MRYILKLIFFIFLLNSVLASSRAEFTFQEDDFEFNYKIGKIASSEEEIDSSTIAGIDYYYNVSNNTQMGLTVNYFENNDYNKIAEVSLTPSVDSTLTTSSILEEDPVLFNLRLKYKFNITPILFRYNYKFHYDQFNFSIGAGMGLSYNKMKVKSKYMPVDEQDTDFENNIETISHVSSNIDHSFVYSLNANVDYPINDDWRVGLIFAYTNGTTDLKVTQQITDVGETLNRNYELDLEYFSVFFNIKYKIFA